MLIRFNVGNFLSFGDMQSFSMVPGKTNEHPDHIINHENMDLLRSSYIYGPNSSGKSNLISAMYYSRNKILDLPMDVMRSDYKLFNAPRHKTKNNGEVDEPSYIEYILSINDEVYSYGFEIDIGLDILLSEWLIKIDGDSEEVIYSLEYQDGMLVTECCDECISELMEEYSSGKKEITFLKYAYCHGIYNRIDLVYSWFEISLMIRTSNTMNHVLIFKENPLKKLETCLSKFDVNIGSVLLSHHSRITKSHRIDNSDLTSYIEDKELTKYMQDHGCSAALICDNGNLFFKNIDEPMQEVLFSHITNPAFVTHLSGESDGTIRIIRLLIDLMAEFELFPVRETYNVSSFPDYIKCSTSDSRTLIVDEIECGIHVKLLSELLTQVFNLSNKILQFVATTHEVELLSKEKLRTDEIWFMDVHDTSEDRQSVLYSLERYKNVDKKSIKEDYMSGIYGAIPFPFEN